MSKQLIPLFNWCAIVCEYRTDFYDDYKQMEYKIDKALDKQ